MQSNFFHFLFLLMVHLTKGCTFYEIFSCLLRSQSHLIDYIYVYLAFISNLVAHSQVDNYITRPTSCEGVVDSGVSDGSENIFSSEIDNTSQIQTVIRQLFSLS